MNETSQPRSTDDGNARRSYILMCVFATLTMGGVVTAAVVLLLQ